MFACEFQPLVDAPLANRAADQLMAQSGCGSITLFLIDNAHLTSFFVSQDRLVFGARQRPFGEFHRGAHIQQLWLVTEDLTRADGFRALFR